MKRKSYSYLHYSLVKDCLNPPLTNIPRSKWMCPAHPEKFFNDTQELFNSQKVQIHDIFTNKGTLTRNFFAHAFVVDPDEVIRTLLMKRNSLKSASKMMDRSTISMTNLRSVKSRKRTRQGIVPCGVKRLYRSYRVSFILKDIFSTKIVGVENSQIKFRRLTFCRFNIEVE